MDRSKHIGHHVCICVFFSNPVSVERSVVSSILDIFTSSFNVNLKSARRDGGPKSSARIENREWFLNAVDTMHRESNMDDVAFADDSLDRSRDARLLWSFSVDYRRKWMQRQDRPALCVLTISVGFEFEKTAGQIQRFVDQLCVRLMQQPNLHYAIIDPVSRMAVPWPGYCWWDVELHHPSWEACVKRFARVFYDGHRRDKVIDLFWGMVFGRSLSKRLLDADFLKKFNDASDEWSFRSNVGFDQEWKCISIQLDNDLISFARTRDHAHEPFDDVSNADDALRNAIYSGAFMKHFLSSIEML